MRNRRRRCPERRIGNGFGEDVLRVTVTCRDVVEEPIGRQSLQIHVSVPLVRAHATGAVQSYHMAAPPRSASSHPGRQSQTADRCYSWKPGRLDRSFRVAYD